MSDVGSPPPVQIGEQAPDFTLPAVDPPRLISLSDYRGRSAVLLALFRGVWCPYCRRQVALLSRNQEKLRHLGVDSVGVIATSIERARLYFSSRPTTMMLLVDPELRTHAAYRLLRVPITPEFEQVRRAVQINPTGELPQPMTPPEVRLALNRIDGFEPTDIDDEERARQVLRDAFQYAGVFLIDRSGVVRWSNLEGAVDGLAGLGRFPTEGEILRAAGAL